MNRNIFFLLAVCCVATSGQKVDVHVTEVTGYTKLEFIGAKSKSKTFGLSATETAASNVKVSSGTIAEVGLEIGFTAESASILAVTQPAIHVAKRSFCEEGGRCIEKNKYVNPDKYTIHVNGIGDQQKQMICGPYTVTLVHSVKTPSSDSGLQLKVNAGVIKETAFAIPDNFDKCEISEVIIKQAKSIVENPDCVPGMSACFKNAATFNASFKLGLFSVCLLLGKVM